MKCKLCREVKSFAESHIIPSFMHKELFKDAPHHQIIKEDIEGLKEDKFSRISSGEYDKTILCHDCEKRINVFENYSSIALEGGGQK